MIGKLRISVLFVAVALNSATATAQDDPLLVQSREVTAEFAARMQAALQQGMASGGPVAAIGVCKDIAPDIAERLSAESGAAVSRTSLKVRNPDNAPEDWQRDVLNEFESAETEEIIDRVGEAGGRYIKAIQTRSLCLI